MLELMGGTKPIMVENNMCFSLYILMNTCVVYILHILNSEKCLFNFDINMLCRIFFSLLFCMFTNV